MLSVLFVRALIVVTMLIVFAAVLGGLLLLLQRPWWPSVVFQTGQRPRAYVPWLIGTFATIAILGYVIFDAAGLATGSLLWFIFAPAVIVPRATKTAWKSDNEDQREGALAVRNRVRLAAGEPELDGTECWNQYVLDRARAERQAEYQPPGAG